MSKNVKDYLKKLSGIPLFSGIEDDEMLPMMGCIGAFIKEYKKDELIYLDNAATSSIGVVLEGNVHVIQEDLWGNKAILVNIAPGELFGETFVCTAGNNDLVSFIATETTTVIFLPFERVMRSCSMACGHHHKLIKNMVTVIAGKNKQLMRKIDVISKGTLREKIAAYLTRMAEDNGSMNFDIPMGRIQLAEYLHADRSALSRELNNMKKTGLIEFDKKTFHILKPLF